MSLGTSGTVYSVTPVGVKDASGAINGYADATGRFMPMVTTLNAAKVTDCIRRLLGVTVQEFDSLALEPRQANNSLILIPYLDGERTPDLPDATGRLLNLRSNSTRAEVARAAVEGVLCGLLEGLDLLAKQGIRLDRRFILTGGAARSKVFQTNISRSYRQTDLDCHDRGGCGGWCWGASRCRSLWRADIKNCQEMGAGPRVSRGTGSRLSTRSGPRALPDCGAKPLR